MIITDSKKIVEIQREFNTKFPYLKLEFYKAKHRPGEGSPIELQIDRELTVGQVRTIHNEEEFKIRRDLKVTDLEKIFHDRFGLNVQVFRKSGNLWMQTTSTDHWTLDMQNRKGGSSESAFREKYEI